MSDEESVELDSKIPQRVNPDRLGISLSLDRVSKKYAGIQALESTSIQIPAGDTVGVIGHEGAGKTSLLNIICGLSQPTSGDIYINRKKVTKSNARKHALLGVRRVFQEPVIFEELTIEENIILGSPPSQGDGLLASFFMPKMVSKERKETARELMSYCGIEIANSTHLSLLPNSTKKLIELARALMGNPRVLVLDEPSVSLDEDEKAKYAQVVSDYCETFSTTLLLADHDIDFVKSLCKRALAIDAGKLLADGELVDVLHNKDVKLIKLGDKR